MNPTQKQRREKFIAEFAALEQKLIELGVPLVKIEACQISAYDIARQVGDPDVYLETVEMLAMSRFN